MQEIINLPEEVNESTVLFKITTTTLKCSLVKFVELIMLLLGFKSKITQLIVLESFLKFKGLSSRLSQFLMSILSSSIGGQTTQALRLLISSFTIRIAKINGNKL